MRHSKESGLEPLGANGGFCAGRGAGRGLAGPPSNAPFEGKGRAIAKQWLPPASFSRSEPARGPRR
jgi:hypothetical protein